MSDAHDKRRFTIKSEILKALNRASGYSMPENVLHRDLNLSLQPPAMIGEFRGELEELQSLGMISMVAGSLGAPRKIRLTDEGRAEVEAHLSQ
jgi:hypothetical protein